MGNPPVVPEGTHAALVKILTPGNPITILSAWARLLGVTYPALCTVIAHAYMSAYSVEGPTSHF